MCKGYAIRETRLSLIIRCNELPNFGNELDVNQQSVQCKIRVSELWAG